MAASRRGSFVPRQRRVGGLPEEVEPRVPLTGKGAGHPRGPEVGLFGGTETSFFP